MDGIDLTGLSTEDLTAIKAALESGDYSSLTDSQLGTFNIIVQQSQQIQAPQTIQLQGAAPSYSLPEKIYRGAGEFAAGVNRAPAWLLDRLVTDPANAIMQMTGSERRFGGFEQAAAPPAGTYLGEGSRGARYLQNIGEFAGTGIGTTGLLRRMTADAVRAGEMIIPQATQAGRNVLRQIGSTPLSVEAATGVTSGAGYTFGEDALGTIGGIVGGLLGGLPGPALARRLSSTSKSILDQLTSTFNSVPQSATNTQARNEAIQRIAENLQNAGVSPRDVENALNEIGSIGIPADANKTLLDMLNQVAKQIPDISAGASTIIQERSGGAMQRFIQSIREATGAPPATSKQIIENFWKDSGPEIERLYQAAYQAEVKLPTNIFLDISRDGVWKKYFDMANAELNIARTARPDDVTLKGNMALIDYMKRSLDDEITNLFRAGNNNKARNLLELKNTLLEQANNIPEYSQARRTFSTIKDLESAVDQGRQALDYMELEDLTAYFNSLSILEKEMFKYGLTDYAINKVRNMTEGSDITRVFGKYGNGDVLRTVIGDVSYDELRSAMNAEQNLRRTEGGFKPRKEPATTTGQAVDEVNVPVTRYGVISQAANSLMRRLTAAKRNNDAEEQQRIAREIGRFLIDQGADPVAIRNDLVQAGWRNLVSKLAVAARSTRPTAISATAPMIPAIAGQGNNQ